MYYKFYVDIVDINEMLLYDFIKIIGFVLRKIGIDFCVYFLNN